VVRFAAVKNFVWSPNLDNVISDSGFNQVSVTLNTIDDINGCYDDVYTMTATPVDAPGVAVVEEYPIKTTIETLDKFGGGNDEQLAHGVEYQIQFRLKLNDVYTRTITMPGTFKPCAYPIVSLVDAVIMSCSTVGSCVGIARCPRPMGAYECDCIACQA